MYRRTLLNGFVTPLLGIFVASMPATARAGDCSGLPTITGEDLTSIFPATPNALQDNPTGFGDATPPTMEDAEGNELDQLFLANDGTDLYIGITGNTEVSDQNDNTFLVFIDTGAGGGTAILDTSGMTGSAALIGLDPDDMTDGVTLDFAPEWALAAWNVAGTPMGVLHDLTDPLNVGTALTAGTDFVIDNSNQAGVNAAAASDPLAQQANAATATTGFEFKVPLATLGITSSSTINVQVLLVSGTGFISNQSLPPLNPTSGGTGGGVDCIGNHDPNNVENPNVVDFSAPQFPGNQNVSFVLNPAGAAPGGVFDGTDIPNRYTAVGQLAATQNNFTCFGNAAPFSPIPTGGAEIDQIFASVDFSKLYIGVTGNIPFFGGNNDALLIFIDDPNNFDGTQTLFTSDFVGGSGALTGMSQGVFGGFTFDNGFAPEWVIEYWRAGAQHNARIVNLPFDEQTIMEFSPSSDRHTNPAVNAFGADLGNIAGVNDIPGDDPIRQETFAATAANGIQFSIRLADLGLDASGGTLNVKLCAGIVSGSGFVSNQWIPPLNPTVLPPVMDAASFSDAPLPLAVPDNTGADATDTRTVTMAGIDRITDINVSVAITHPDVSQLSISLRHDDSGRIVNLVGLGNQTGANLNLTFDSEGAPAVQPNESLLTFNGVDPNGGWTMIVTDAVTGQTGTLDSWGIAVTEHTGGNVGCLGQFDAIDNPLNLSDPAFPGNQFFDKTGASAFPANPAFRPTSFSGTGIPAAFGNTPLTDGVASGTQNNFTCFGNAVEAAMVNLPGSELDQVRVRNTNDRLKVALTGNLENNGNAVVLLLDTDGAAGSSTITGQTSPPDAVGGNPGEPGFNGLVLDAGFTPDYAIAVQRDPTAGVPDDDYNVYIKELMTNTTRTIGRLTRNTGSGLLGDAVPNQNGSELNELYVQNDADRLYLGITGNLEANNNHWIIFLQTTANGSGSTQLNTNHIGFPTALRAVNCDVMEVGFQPEFAIVYNRNGGVPSAQLVDLLDIPPGVTVTTLTHQNTVGDNVFFVDNTNGLGVNSNAADDDDMGAPPSQQILNAMTATRGVQFAIARSSLGHTEPMVVAPPNDGDPIKICAFVVSATGFWSNQILPGLGGGISNLGDPAPGCPTGFVDLGVEVDAPGQQVTTFNLAGMAGYATPSSFNGADIPTVMGPGNGGQLLATQDNFTQFGDAVLINPGNANCTQVALNNENILGVTAASATPSEAASAANGLEFDIAFQDIGLTPLDPVTGPFVEVKLMAALTGRFGFFSNQVLPGLMRDPDAANLGNIGVGWSGDLSDVANAPGNQFLSYTLVPFCGDDPADINADEIVDDADITAFVGVLLETNTNACDVQKADVNGIPPADGRDVQPFIQEFLTP